MSVRPDARGARLLAASAAIFIVEIANIAVWRNAFDSAQTQAARVDNYLSSLPLQLGGLGSLGITLLAIALAIIGATLAFVAGRRYRASRTLSVLFNAGNTIVALWLLFTLM